MKAPLPNRVAIEAELSAEELVVLRDWCARFRVHPTRWQELKPWCQTFESVAADRLAERLRHTEGLSRSRSITEAAARLGVNGETLRARLAGWSRQSPRHTATATASCWKFHQTRDSRT